MSMLQQKQAQKCLARNFRRFLIMSPLNIEVFNAEKQNWVKAGELRPGDPPGSISQNKPDGSREIYLFQCEPDDKSSVIYRSEGGVDIESPQTRVVGTTGLEVVARLTDGQSHTISVKTDVSDAIRVVRFTHQER